MNANRLKTVNKAIVKARSELTTVQLKDLVRPTSIEEGRANLKRFYGCVKGDLLVLLDTKDRDGAHIEIIPGYREKGRWVSLSKNTPASEPHSAINNLMVMDEYAIASVNIDHMTSLSDLYKITGSGCFNGRSDPSFTMNLILGGEDPITQYDACYFEKYIQLFDKIAERLNLKYREDWYEDSSAFDLYDNNDPIARKWEGFYRYSVQKGFDWRWRQMNNLDTRYLHWLLLGPFAPYRFSDSDVTASAA